MLHKFRVQYILIDFSDNGFLVFPSVSFSILLKKKRKKSVLAVATSGYYSVAQLWCCLMYDGDARTWEVATKDPPMIHINNRKKAKAKHLRQHRGALQTTEKISLNNYYYVYSPCN